MAAYRSKERQTSYERKKTSLKIKNGIFVISFAKAGCQKSLLSNNFFDLLIL
jgi:hypothetical protein